MSTVEESIDVEVPVRTAYNQWTQFESFPRFMQGVERVEQRGPDMTHWVTRIGGVTREFDAEIVEQSPDERVAWRTLEGPRQMGVVAFQSLDPDHTRVHLRMDFDPEGLVEKTGDALGIVKHRVHDDLEHFKEFIESRGSETGAWRGEIHRGQVQEPAGGTTPGMGAAGAGAAGAGAAYGAGATYGEQGERLGESAPQMGQEQRLEREQMIPGQEPQLGAESRQYGQGPTQAQYPGETRGELGEESARGREREGLGESAYPGAAPPEALQEQPGDVYTGEERATGTTPSDRLEDEEQRGMRPGDERRGL